MSLADHVSAMPSIQTGACSPIQPASLRKSSREGVGFERKREIDIQFFQERILKSFQNGLQKGPARI
jgi:hypothetical protein